jgi:alkylated DNA repair dioxygenase AlkB
MIKMQTNLFGSTKQQQLIGDDLLQYIPDFFNADESHEYFTSLQNTIAWKQEELKLYGKIIKTPRFTAWYGDDGMAYKYSGVTFYALPWTDKLLKINAAIEPLAGQQFNSVLLNMYRDGNDSMGWHSDDEPELGKNPIIASVNFGQARRFDFRMVKDYSVKHQLMLGNGSLLIMKGDIQHHWQHQIAKSLRIKQPRINLTFRKIL